MRRNLANLAVAVPWALFALACGGRSSLSIIDSGGSAGAEPASSAEPDQPLPETFCGTHVCSDDGDPCNGEEQCDEAARECVHVDPIECDDDGNACSGEERCDPDSGRCVSEGGIECDDDGNACNGEERCDPNSGRCVSEGGIECDDDGNACNGEERCDPNSGRCVSEGGVSCADDGDLCNGQELCDPGTGACHSVNPIRCTDDGIYCNGGVTCEPATGRCVDVPLPAECIDDGNLCNGLERCDEANRACWTSDPPPSTDDGLLCNGQEYCDPALGWVAGTSVICDGPHQRCTEPDGSCACEPGWQLDDCSLGVRDYVGFSEVRQITVDGDLLWLATTSGLWLRDMAGTPGDPSDDRDLEFSYPDGLLGQDVQGIAIDESGGKWIATYVANGLQYFDDGGTPFDKSDDIWTSVPTMPDPNHSTVTDVALDGQGDVWVIHGIVQAERLDPAGTPSDPSDDRWDSVVDLGGSAPSGTKRLTGDPGRAIWITAYQGGLQVWDEAAQAFAAFNTENSSLPGDRVGFVELDGDHGLWIALGNPGNFLEPRWLAYLDHNGTLRDGSDDQYATYVQRPEHDFIEALSPEPNGLLWIGDEQTGLSVLDTAGTPLDPTDDGFNVVAQNVGWVQDIAPLSDSELLFGGFGGLYYLSHQGTADTADDNLVSLMPPSRLRARTVNAMAIDSNGGKWLGTSMGAEYFDDGGTPLEPSDDRWQQFGNSDTADLAQVTDVELGPVGIKYFSQPEWVHILADGGTPLLKDDDQWVRLDVSVDILPSYGYLADLAVDPQWNVVVMPQWSDEGYLLYVLNDGGTPLDVTDDAWIGAGSNANGVGRYLRFDADGGGWIGTVNGLWYWDDQGTRLEPSDDTWTWVSANVLAEGTEIYGLDVSQPHAAWIALGDGRIAFLDHGGTPSDPSDDRWAFYGTAEGVAAFAGGRHLAAEGDRLWMKGEDGVAQLDTAGTPFDPSDDSWWILHAQEQIVSPYVMDIDVDPRGGAWISSSSGGITYAVVDPG